MLDRLSYEMNSIFGVHARRRLKRTPAQVLRDSNQFWVSAETGEAGIKACVDAIGSERILYASDFPHEPPKATIVQELKELATRCDLTEAERQNILNRNVKRFVGITQ